MTELNEGILDDQFIDKPLSRRRDLLPKWIKFFVWVFMIFGAFVPIVFILGMAGISFNVALYGFGTMNPFSFGGLIIQLLFGLKGIVAFGLWTEKKWAVDLAMADAGIGIIFCLMVQFRAPFLDIYIRDGGFRLELFFLIPYLIKMNRIKQEWIEREPLIK